MDGEISMAGYKNISILYSYSTKYKAETVYRDVQP